MPYLPTMFEEFPPSREWSELGASFTPREEVSGSTPVRRDEWIALVQQQELLDRRLAAIVRALETFGGW